MARRKKPLSQVEVNRRRGQGRDAQEQEANKLLEKVSGVGSFRRKLRTRTSKRNPWFIDIQ